MDIIIEKGRACGAVNAPPSKSMAHRLLIAAAISQGQSLVRGISDCEDVKATLDCLTALGIRTERRGSDILVHGRDPRTLCPNGPLYCKESGSTLRFLIPIALLSEKNTIFYGDEGLMSRPMDVYASVCKEKGLSFLQDERSIAVKGPLKAGEYSLVGNVSSQFISGLLFALSSLDSDSKITITTSIESRSYIDLTLEALTVFGADISWVDDSTLFIKGGQRLTGRAVTVEGDYSGAAFTDALNLFGGDVNVMGLSETSSQGDRIYKKFFEMLKTGVPTLHIGNCPDLGPILFAIAAAKHGGVFTGTRRLRIKESDRASAMAEELRKFGTSVTVYDDKVVVYPMAFHKPALPLSGHNDHRIVMALSVLLTETGGKITGAEAVKKSYPDFFKDLSSLGIEVKEYEA